MAYCLGRNDCNGSVDVLFACDCSFALGVHLLIVVDVGQVARVRSWKERVGKVKVDQLTVGWCVRWRVIDQVTECVGINVLGRYCDEVFICNAFHFAKFVVEVP